MPAKHSIGQLRNRFTLERRATDTDGYGDTQPVWKPVGQLWGSLETLGGRQLQLAQASTITSTATHLIEIRYSADVAIAKTRLSLPSRPSPRTFEINAIDDVDNRHARMFLTVTEVRA